MKPKISFDTLKMTSKSLYHVFAHVANNDDFKQVFIAQAAAKFGSLQQTVAEHCQGDPSLIRRIEDYANSDKNFSVLLKTMIANIFHFENATIPTRPCDFFVEQPGQQETYFWIDERIELDFDTIRGRFFLAKLMVDPKSDLLLFNNGEDGWEEYTHANGEFSAKVQIAYDNYLADTQILKD